MNAEETLRDAARALYRWQNERGDDWRAFQALLVAERDGLHKFLETASADADLMRAQGRIAVINRILEIAERAPLILRGNS